MELNEALAQVSEIRRQMAQAEVFRGYRALTAGFSAGVAFVVAGIQPWVVPVPSEEPIRYIALWVAAALVCIVATGVEMTVRCRRSAALGTQRQMLRVGELFLPSLIAGALLTIVLAEFAPTTLWMLPGLWAVLFSLGMFASCRVLPPPVGLVALYYLVSGAGALAWAQGELAFSPWAMIASFGVGQLLSSLTLYLTLEHRHGQD
jgi:hypothetical protein